jgi:dienelactone hydrolase
VIRALALVAVLALAWGARADAAGIALVPATATTPAIPAYVARPPGPGPFPAVLMLHGCEGFNGFLAVSADRLAAQGYVAVAIDAETPSGIADGCGSSGDPFGAQLRAARATLAWMRTQPGIAPDRLGVIGFSMGADSALSLIDPVHGGPPVPDGLRAAVAFYPSCRGHDGNVAVPLAIFDGSADGIAPPAPCTTMVHAGTAADRTLQITTYPGATHAFVVPGPERTFFGQPIRFDPEAAADSARERSTFSAAI